MKSLNQLAELTQHTCVLVYRCVCLPSFQRKSKLNNPQETMLSKSIKQTNNSTKSPRPKGVQTRQHNTQMIVLGTAQIGCKINDDE